MHCGFTNYLINGNIFGGKKLISIKHFDFLHNLALQYLVLRGIQLHIITNLPTKSTSYFCQISTKPELSPHIFEQSLKIKFHENPSSGGRGPPRGRKDLTELTVAFWQSCERA
jgi:hypothetical protein